MPKRKYVQPEMFSGEEKPKRGLPFWAVYRKSDESYLGTVQASSSGAAVFIGRIRFKLELHEMNVLKSSDSFAEQYAKERVKAEIAERNAED